MDWRSMGTALVPALLPASRAQRLDGSGVRRGRRMRVQQLPHTTSDEWRVLMGGDIVKRLRDHVNNRGGPSIQNGAWEMMLEAADEIERLRGRAVEADQTAYVAALKAQFR